MKKIIILLLLLGSLGNLFAQLSINSNNDVVLPFGKSYWIGNALDNGNRLRLHHNNSSAYFDYYPRLIMRKFNPATNGGYGDDIYPWIFDKVNGGDTYSDPIMYCSSNWGILGKYDAPLYQIYSYNIWLNGWLTISSDERLKTNIKNMSGCLKKIRSVKGVSYDFNPSVDNNIPSNNIGDISVSSPKNNINNLQKTLTNKRTEELRIQNKNRIGFIAQDLKEIFPELVKKDTSTGLYGVDYIGMIPILTNAVNEQQAIIEKQDSIIRSKVADINTIKAELVEIKKQLNKKVN